MLLAEARLECCLIQSWRAENVAGLCYIIFFQFRQVLTLWQLRSLTQLPKSFLFFYFLFASYVIISEYPVRGLVPGFDILGRFGLGIWTPLSMLGKISRALDQGYKWDSGVCFSRIDHA